MSNDCCNLKVVLGFLFCFDLLCFLFYFCYLFFFVVTKMKKFLAGDSILSCKTSGALSTKIFITIIFLSYLAYKWQA